MLTLSDFQHELIKSIEKLSVSGDSFVSIMLDQQCWLVDLMLIKEASVPPRIAKNARAPGWVVGITNFRGDVWTVLDMRVLIKNENTANPNWGWMTLLHPQQEQKIALLWSEIVEIGSKEEYDAVSDAPKEPYCRQVWKDRHGKIWKELDVEQIVGPAGLIASWRQNETDIR